MISYLRIKALLGLAALAAILSTGLCAQTFTGTNTGAIADGTGGATYVPGANRDVNFAVTGLTGNVATVSVTFQMNPAHSWVGDLTCQLISPASAGSVTFIIFARTGSTTAGGAGFSSNFTASANYTFNDAAAGNWWTAAAATPIAAGSYRTSSTGGVAGGGALTSIDPVYAGLTPAQSTGTWILRFFDGFAGDTGTISAASLTFTVSAPPVPTITSLNPTSGSTLGGTSVVITGTNFTGATAVAFGATAATSFTVDSATQITAVAPAGAAGAVDVTVTTPAGTSANTAADDYTYTVVAPTVVSLNPTSGSTAGGNSVVITGTAFTGTTAVAFGATAATGFTVDSATQITATAPAGTGTVDVSVTTPSGTSTNTAADDYTYIPAPAVGGLAPASGPIAGGTTVVITGTDFNGATDVDFGANPATSFTVDSNTQITATSPAGAAGVVDVIVTTGGGASANTANDDFTYVAPEMDVFRGLTAVADNATSDPLGTVPFGIAQTVTYTITNSGTATLNLTGTPVIQITLGSNVTSATVTTPPATTSIAAAASVTFTITYTVTAAAVFDFDVSIANDDADEGTYNWNADGTGASIPEMDVTRAGAIADGGTDAQGNAPAGTAIVLTYTITNNGNTTLNITLPVAISGLTNCTCTVTTPPAATVAAAATTTVVITITPTAAGSFSALVSIANDDSDENPYNWTISGTGTTTGGGGKKKGDDGGCSTGENNSLWMLAGVLASFGLALRLRRKSA